VTNQQVLPSGNRTFVTGASSRNLAYAGGGSSGAVRRIGKLKRSSTATLCVSVTVAVPSRVTSKIG
jgi:hypothetical protein